MGRYIIRRLLQFIPTVMGTTFLLHYLTSIAIQFSGNPVLAIFGDKTPPQETIDAVTRALRLDDPCLREKFNPCVGLYGERLKAMFLHFDFGVTMQRRSVTEVVGDALPYTLKLALIAVLVEIVVGVGAGLLAGLRGGSFSDYLVKISTVLVISVPIFVLGVLVRQVWGVTLGNWARQQSWMPEDIANGLFVPLYKPDYPWLSLVMPGLVLGAITLAATARLTRTAVQENIRADYVRTAKAKGLKRSRIIGVHTLRNSLIPVTTNIGLSLGTYLTGAVVTEGVFTIPGIGGTVAQAVRANEPSTLIGVTMMLVVVYLVINLLVDLLYAVIDPRIRYV
jgi:ABC-type dipeptide/oligopeptide/nickel transport system permease component